MMLEVMTGRKSTILPDSSSVREKHRGDNDDDVDRISDLPDSILGHILSLLPTKNSVATSLLSKRWKLLWTTVGNLDFCCPKDYTGDFTERAERFVQFVNYVLLLHKPGYLNRFSLTWELRYIPPYVNTWISAAVMRRNVHELIVRVKIPKLSNQVKTYMFSSERLESLELNCSICISSEIAFAVSLPRLERLSLISVYFQSEESFSKLLDGCPVLKYLVIHMDIQKMIKYRGFSTFKCMISSTSLRHLELYVYNKYRKGVGLIFCTVQLDAPSLEYIKLADQINSIVVQETLNFLDEANLQLTPFVLYDNEDPKYCNSFVEALDAFGCAKTLILSDEVIRTLSRARIKVQTSFDRLTRLEVTIYRNNWSSLQDLIKLSNNLEVLIVNKRYNAREVDSPKWKTLDRVPMCLSNNLKTVSINAYESLPDELDLVSMCLSNTLKTVSINAYEGLPDELAMIDYLLKHGSVLEVMQISFNKTISDFQRKLELVEQIRAFTRKSPACEVKFSKIS